MADTSKESRRPLLRSLMNKRLSLQTTGRRRSTIILDESGASAKSNSKFKVNSVSHISRSQDKLLSGYDFVNIVQPSKIRSHEFLYSKTFPYNSERNENTKASLNIASRQKSGINRSSSFGSPKSFDSSKNPEIIATRKPNGCGDSHGLRRSNVTAPNISQLDPINSEENNRFGNMEAQYTPFDVALRGRLFAQRYRRRLILKNGDCNLSFVNVKKRQARYLLDLFNTLLDLPWRYSIIVYFLTFIFSWLLYAGIWLGLNLTLSNDDSGVLCVTGVKNFKEAILFSMETQQTIGYGTRAITSRCTSAMFVLMLQSTFGAMMQCVLTGVIFAKLARPTNRSKTIIFSKHAVICMYNGELCFMFRVGDIRHSQLIGLDVNVMLVRRILEADKTKPINLQQQRLRISTENGDDYFFLAWPIKILHRIDHNSPLWGITPEQLLVADLEIIVVLDASCEATGACTQIRTSYLPSEIQWGYDLAPLLSSQREKGHYKVDFSQFHKQIPIETPELSAKQLHERKLSLNFPKTTTNCEFTI